LLFILLRILLAKFIKAYYPVAVYKKVEHGAVVFRFICSQTYMLPYIWDGACWESS